MPLLTLVPPTPAGHGAAPTRSRSHPAGGRWGHPSLHPEPAAERLAGTPSLLQSRDKAHLRSRANQRRDLGGERSHPPLPPGLGQAAQDLLPGSNTGGALRRLHPFIAPSHELRGVCRTFPFSFLLFGRDLSSGCSNAQHRAAHPWRGREALDRSPLPWVQHAGLWGVGRKTFPPVTWMGVRC